MRRRRAGWGFLVGDALAQLRQLPSGIAQACCTSPPYFGLRDYGVEGQVGGERTPEEYVARLVEVFREVRRVLRPDGTLWLNLGDSFSHGGCGSRDPDRRPKQQRNDHMPRHAKKTSMPPKNLLGVPWMAAFALRADGWILRSDIVWGKRNPMPESVADRPTRAHEYVFLLSRQVSYFYDIDAIREPHEMRPQRRPSGRPKDRIPRLRQPKQNWSTARRDDVGVDGHPLGRNKRSVWLLSTKAYRGAHFATFPPELVEPMILAGSRRGDLVIDPFAGTGTTGLVARRHGRRFLGIDLDPRCFDLAIDRREAGR